MQKKTSELQKLINKKRKSFSVIMTFYVLLENYYQTLQSDTDYVGMTSARIREKYNGIAEQYGKKDFANSYLQRHTKTGDFFIESNSHYKIRPKLLENLDIEKSQNILTEIKSYFDSFIQSKLNIINEVSVQKNKISDLENLKTTLKNYMLLEGFNKGQLFEIVSYSILNLYFEHFGFTLNRFSTTFSNDGGMDFIAQDCIYQVTFSPSIKKINNDLIKLPNIKRVLVIPKVSEQILEHIKNEELVFEIITKNDLLNHFLPRIYSRKSTDKLFNKIVFELRREL